ncbi:hypothetical protein [Streptomyces sp. NPDC002952]|uniref:hypothetical protein n=1 Tax=Streptomyces sp. NPDC002952 TaxID=3364673 RepID=UPI00369BE0B8
MAEATSLLGQLAGEPEAGLNTTGKKESFCDWAPKDLSGLGAYGLIQVQAFSSSRFLPRSAYEAGQVHDESVPGASEAFWVRERPAEAALNFVVKGKRVSVTFSPSDHKGAAHEAALLAVVKRMATRI